MRGQTLNEYFEPERGQNKKRPKGQKQYRSKNMEVKNKGRSRGQKKRSKP